MPFALKIAGEQLKLAEKDRKLFIAGPIDTGNGGFNGHWSWHMVPDKWIRDVKQFRPWAS